MPASPQSIDILEFYDLYQSQPLFIRSLLAGTAVALGLPSSSLPLANVQTMTMAVVPRSVEGGLLQRCNCRATAAK